MIKIKNLIKKFGKTPVLDGINLTVKRGDRIALIGQNGAGKTTLIRTILGQYIFNGELAVFDKNPRRHRVEILDRIGYVPQLPPPNAPSSLGFPPQCGPCHFHWLVTK